MRNAVIVDEVSMVDTLLFDALLRGMKPAAKLILVGDFHQLPSVGAGNILRDLIESDTVADGGTKPDFPPGGKESDRHKRA